MTNSLYAVFRKYCREHGEELLLGAFDQFVFIYFIILLINCEKQHVFCIDVCQKASPHLLLFNINLSEEIMKDFPKHFQNVFPP